MKTMIATSTGTRNEGLSTIAAKRKVGRPRIHVPPELIQFLREKGISFRKISLLTGFGYGSVRRAWHNQSAKEKSGGATSKA